MSNDIDDAMLVTKLLRPRRREDILSRQRLLDQLYDMVDDRLVLVSAPAGYGKTTLLVDFAADLEHPVCWYALDAGDRDPRLFLERLVMSLRRRFPDFGTATLRALRGSTDLRGGAPGVVRVLVNEIVSQIPRWFVLVLDDYHTLGSAPDVDAIVSNFVVYQRDQCMTVIASRTVPTLPAIISLVARGGVAGLGQIDMRFTPEEVQALFAQNYGTALSPDEAAVLAEQSEGWITGLLLTALMRWQGVLQSWMRAQGADQPIYDYLAQEVFAEQPPEVQRFLMVSSTLVEMERTLCEEVLGAPDAQASLEQLEAQNLFVTRFDGDWYRYHHLFRDFLQTRYRREDPEGWRAHHLRAARWFEACGQLREAVDHYLAGEAHADAARVMADLAVALYRRGELTTLLAWREQVPDAVLDRAPRLALFQSRAAAKVGQAAEAVALAETAERGYREAGDAEGVAYAQLQRAQVHLFSGKPRAALALGTAALAMIEETGVPVGYEAHRILGLAHVDTGDLQTGRTHLEAAVALAATQGHAYDRALARTALAHCLGLLGEVEPAVALHEEAVAIWRRLESDGGLADELSDLGFHLYALGRYDEAVRTLQEALVLARETGAQRAEAYALVNLGELARDAGALDFAQDVLVQGHELAQENGNTFLTTYSLEALGLVHRAAERWDAAETILEDALSHTADQKGAYQLGRYRASLGVVRAERGAPEAGLQELDAAIQDLAPFDVPVELARARLFRAWALFLRGTQEDAVAALVALLDEVPPGLEAQVFPAEVRRMEPLFDAARRALRGNHARTQRLQGLRNRSRDLNAVAPTLGGASHERRGDRAPGRAAAGRQTEAARTVLTQAAPARTAPGSPDPWQAPSGLRVYGFGTGRAEIDGELVPVPAWGSLAARHLLIYMLIRGRCSRDQIFGDFWPELTTQKAKASFHTTKFRLGRALGREVIVFDGTVYALHPEFDAWFDVRTFAAYLKTWRETQDLEALAQAVALYTDDFLTDCDAEWCLYEREALRVRCLQALETLAERLLARRQYRRAIPTLVKALALEPARETFHQQLMRAYALSGERSRALAQFERCAADLQAGLSVAPSYQTVLLYERILQEQSLD